LQISGFAYWVVFKKRLCDYFLCLLIHNFVHFYERDIVPSIELKFSPMINEGAKALVVELPEIRRVCLHLQSRIENLYNALEILRKL
jgi:hypothetical protein